MLLFQDIITQDEIQCFKKYFADRLGDLELHWSQDGQEVSHRVNIDHNSAEFNVIRRIVERTFPKFDHVWSGYQRQNQPQNIHVDEYYGHQERSPYRYTYVLAMDTVPEFKTFVWKETCWNKSEVDKFVMDWGRTRRFTKKISNISETEDLEHTFDLNQEDYMCDYLNLDGIYPYKSGTACLFRSNQLHCTSNWIKHKHLLSRELLQIHVGTDQAIEI
jgi:hypothetical protein